nr:YetF domain-containing protein [uncultured Sphingomonas sp.]
MELFEGLGSASPVARALVLTSGAVAWTLLLARLVGLRAFSKATAFDFAATVATGSLIAQAGTRSELGDYVQAMAAIGAIFLVQYVLAKGRLLSAGFQKTVDNEPRLLMRDGCFLEEAMRDARVTRATLLEKIRKSDAASVADVKALVLETTGDISVLTGHDLDSRLLEGVRGA